MSEMQGIKAMDMGNGVYWYHSALEAAADAGNKIRETGADGCEIIRRLDGSGKLILHIKEEKQDK